MTRPTALSFIHCLESDLKKLYPKIQVQDFERMIDFEAHKASIAYRVSSEEAFKKDFSLICREIVGETSGSFVFEAHLELRGSTILRENWLWFIQNEIALQEAVKEVFDFLKAYEKDEVQPLLEATEKPAEAVPSQATLEATEKPVEPSAKPAQPSGLTQPIEPA